MDLPRESGPDPLSQPTRARLFALLGELKRPAGTEELAERLGLHPNGVRAHLRRLERGGLVARSQRQHPRGRPADEWSVAPGARPAGEAPRAYRDLARWLAEVTPASGRRLREVEATGRSIGAEIAPRPTGPLAETLRTTLSALGYQPDVNARGGRVTCVLGNCPYRDAAVANQEVVCTLHRGITRGLLDVLDPAARLTDFVPRDPRAAGCVVEVERTEHAAAPG